MKYNIETFLIVAVLVASVLAIGVGLEELGKAEVSTTIEKIVRQK